MDIKPLKSVIIIENIFAVHRDILVKGTFSRGIIFSHIVAHIALIIWSFQFRLHYAVTHMNLLFNLVLCLQSSSIILLAFYHSKEFTKAITIFRLIHSCISSDLVYLKELNILKNVVVSFSVFIIVFRVVMTVMMSNQFYAYIPFISTFALYVFHTIDAVMAMRQFLEFIFMNCIFNIVSRQLDTITRSIETYIENYPVTSIIVMNKIWRDTFMNIKELSSLLNKVFHEQFIIMVGTITFFYMHMLYNFIYMTVQRKLSVNQYTLMTVILLIVLLCLTLITSSSQNVKNSYQKLKRCLGKLCTRCCHNETEYRAVKDCLRQVAASPVFMHSAGTGLAFLPQFLFFVVIYAITILQINNIV